MNEFKEVKKIESEEIQEDLSLGEKDELGIMAVQEGVWQEYMLKTSKYKGSLMFKKVANQNLVEIYFNARHLLNEQGSHFFNILPEGYRPNGSRTIMGVVGYKTGSEYETVVQYLNVDVDGEIGIPGMPGAVTKDFIFYGIYSLV